MFVARDSAWPAIDLTAYRMNAQPRPAVYFRASASGTGRILTISSAVLRC